MNPNLIVFLSPIPLELAMCWMDYLNWFDVEYVGPNFKSCPKQGDWIKDYLSLN